MIPMWKWIHWMNRRITTICKNKMESQNVEHTKYVNSIHINPWTPPDSVQSKKSKRTIQRHIKLYCKKDKHTYQFVKRYGIDHIQCEYCGHRKLKPGDECSYYMKWEYDNLPKQMTVLFDNAFTYKKEDKND